MKVLNKSLVTALTLSILTTAASATPTYVFKRPAPGLRCAGSGCIVSAQYLPPFDASTLLAQGQVLAQALSMYLFSNGWALPPTVNDLVPAYICSEPIPQEAAMASADKAVASSWSYTSAIASPNALIGGDGNPLAYSDQGQALNSPYYPLTYPSLPVTVTLQPVKPEVCAAITAANANGASCANGTFTMTLTAGSFQLLAREQDTAPSWLHQPFKPWPGAVLCPYVAPL